MVQNTLVSIIRADGSPRYAMGDMLVGADGELYTHFAVGCLRIYLSLIIFTCVQKVCAIFLQSIGHAKAAPVADILAIAITSVVMVRLWKQLGEVHESRTSESVLPEYIRNTVPKR